MRTNLSKVESDGAGGDVIPGPDPEETQPGALVVALSAAPGENDVDVDRSDAAAGCEFVDDRLRLSE